MSRRRSPCVSAANAATASVTVVWCESRQHPRSLPSAVGSGHPQISDDDDLRTDPRDRSSSSANWRLCGSAQRSLGETAQGKKSPNAVVVRRVGAKDYDPPMRQDEREVLERAIQRITEQAANADAIVDEAVAAGLDRSDPLTVHVKMLRAGRC
jgi:hypothetical protein